MYICSNDTAAMVYLHRLVASAVPKKISLEHSALADFPPPLPVLSGCSGGLAHAEEATSPTILAFYNSKLISFFAGSTVLKHRLRSTAQLTSKGKRRRPTADHVFLTQKLSKEPFLIACAIGSGLLTTVGLSRR